MDNTEHTSQDINTVAERILSEGTAPKTQGDERRRSLIEAAYHLIAEGGFEGLRTRNIAARAGVNIATLHYYFARKEDLIRGVVEYLLQQFMTAYLPGSRFEMRTPLEQIRGELAEMQYLLQEKPEMFIVLNELVLRSLHDPAIHAMIKWLDEGWHSYLEQVIRKGQEQGIFRANLDPGSAATWLILLTKGTTLHYMTNSEAVDFDRIRTEVEHWLTGSQTIT
ncbi:MAG TPA: TetR/AcrR family transcriptional regulator [Ktedonobacteraceae bacterium]|jgi:AcrR family transcriptional regulator|nr:TetR/AcrR family transcriptional regulator [Ktedonobacteraceae bacterium]